MKKLLILFFGCTVAGLHAQKKWSLQDCVGYAMDHNLQIIQNNYNKDLQNKNLAIAKKQYLPTVDGSFNNNGNFGALRFGSVIQRNDSYSNNVNVNGNILLYNNKRLEKSIRKVEFDVEASQNDLEAIKNDISIQIAQQYLSILLKKEVFKIAQSTLQNAQKIYDRAKITTEVGTTAKTVLAEAAASLAREKQNVKTAEINVKRSLFDLVQLLQLSDYSNFDVQDAPTQNTINPPLYSAENIISTALEGQPQIKAAESRVKSAEVQTKITQTSFWPTISGSAGLGTSYFNYLNQGGDDGLFKQYKDNFLQQIGLIANIPIFNKGITKLQVEQSKINEDIAKNSLEVQKQQIKQNVQKAQFDAESNYEIYIAATEAEKSAQLALDFAEKSYEAGRSTIYDVNSARNNYANAQGSTAQAKYNYLFSLKLLNFYAGIPIEL